MSRDGPKGGMLGRPASTRLWSRRIRRAPVQAREERPALAKTGDRLTCLRSFGRILFGGAGGCFSFVAGALDDAPALRARAASERARRRVAFDAAAPDAT